MACAALSVYEFVPDRDHHKAIAGYVGREAEIETLNADRRSDGLLAERPSFDYLSLVKKQIS